ncbi:MAG: tRNA pseudouridine(13) synthase TruD [Porticoccaceae bacterium]|nr:MAG: tRNA pseudouridine(13) synthase TruD [Porticoccaceae bacterium]
MSGPESVFDLDFPQAHGARVCRARLRALPEDFQVEELLPAEFAFTGTGEHLCLLIRKRGENTRWVARQLAASTGVAEPDVGYCGLKDRHALTTQWFSVPTAAAAAPDLGALDAEVLELRRHRTKLRRGEHAANRFLIRLRDVEGERTAIEQRLAVIARGVPNYFGAQRFGIDGGNLPAADRLLHGFGSQRDARQSGRPATGRKSKGRPQGARIGDDPRNGIFLSAARSWLFNLVLAERVRTDCWRHPLDGEAIPEGPLWGRGRPVAVAAVAALEQEVLGAWQHWLHALEHVGLAQERRPLVLLPRAFNWRWEDADLVLGFELDKGAYATAVLLELVSPAGPEAADRCAILPPSHEGIRE